MEASTIENPSATNGLTTKEAWAARGVHEVTLYSGARVKIRIPDLARLLKHDLLPEGLRGVALRQAFGQLEMGGGSSPDVPPPTDADRYKTAKELAELMDWLLLDMLVDPVLEREDLDGIPSEDKDLLVSLAQRERDTDALGVRVGVEPLSRWDAWRSAHGCDDDCPECQNVVSAFSTVKV